MSDVSARLLLDATQAFATVNNLEQRLAAAAGRFGTSLSDSIARVQGQTLVINADASDVTRSIDGAVDAADTSAELDVDTAPARQEVEKFTTSTESSFRKLAGLAAGVFSAQAIVSGLRAATDAASDLAESTSKVNVVFGEASDEVFAFGETSAQSVGLAKQEALEAAGTFGNLFTAMGLGADAAATLSPEIVTLGADLASFNNLGVPETLEKLRSGLVGEIEPLRSLGISFGAADVEARAMELGLVAVGEELTEGAKLQARWSLITEQSSAAQGDFARTSEGLANQTRIAKAELGNAAAEVGTALIPAVLEGVTAFREIIPEIIELGTSVGEVAAASIPALQAGLSITVPVLGSFADILVALTPVLQVTAGLIERIPPQAITMGVAFASVSKAGRLTTTTVDGLGNSVTKLNPIIAGLTLATGVIASVVGEHSEAERERKAAVDSTSQSLLAAENASAAYATATGEILTGTDDTSRALREAGVTQSELTAATLDRAKAEEIMGRVIETGIDLSIKEVSALDALIGAQAKGAQAAFDGALATEEFTKAQADAAVAANTNAAGVTDYAGALDTARGSAAASAKASGVLTEALAATGEAAVINEEGVKAAQESIDSWIKSIQDGLPAVTDALQDLNDNGRVSIQEFTKSLEEQTKQIAEFPNTINTLFALGFEDLAGFLSTEGPEVTAQFAEDIRRGGPDVAAAADAAIRGNVESAVAATDQLVKGPAGEVIKADFDYLGEQALIGLDQGTGPLPARVGAAVQSAAAAFARETQAAAPGIESGGFFLGDAMGGGVSRGLQAKAQEVAQQAINVVIQAITSARRAADAQSPSRVFARLGEDMGDGVAVGLAASTRSVVAEAEAIVAAAASGVTAAPGSVSGGGGGVQINVDVSGTVTPQDASLIGERIGTAVASRLGALDLLDVDFDARTI